MKASTSLLLVNQADSRCFCLRNKVLRNGRSDKAISTKVVPSDGRFSKTMIGNGRFGEKNKNLREITEWILEI